MSVGETTGRRLGSESTGKHQRGFRPTDRGDKGATGWHGGSAGTITGNRDDAGIALRFCAFDFATPSAGGMGNAVTSPEGKVMRRQSRRVGRPGWFAWSAACASVIAAAAVPGASAGDQPVVATPAGTRYSVSPALFGDPDGAGPQPPQCIYIFNPNLPGAQDDLVLFDGADETLRTNVFGTVPTVSESVDIQQDGVFRLAINVFSPIGTDLFPAGLTNSVGQPYVTGCFSLGIDDTLDWQGIDTVLTGLITLRKYVGPTCDGGSASGQPCTGDPNCPGGFCSNLGQIIQGPTNITGQLTPWLGQFNRILNNAVGKGINLVELELLVRKDIDPPSNDDCFNAFPVATGNVSYSTLGGSTDGPNEPVACNVNGSTQIDSDIWFHHTATCTGDLNVDLCNSFFDTRLAIYDGCIECPSDEGPLACSDDVDFCGTFGQQSKLAIPSVLGHCYTIRVGGYRGDQGRGTMFISCTRGACCKEGMCFEGLNRTACEAGEGQWFPNRACGGFTCPAPPPPNDDCQTAIPLTTGVPYVGTTLGATGTAASACSFQDSADAWHTWTATCTGRARVTLCESEFDTTLSLFDSCGGTEFACDDDGCGTGGLRSDLLLSVDQGQELVIRVSGYNGARGNYKIVVEPCAPENQACCLASGACANALPETCLQFNGIPRGPGSTCRGDFNGNRIDDGCEPCPPAEFADSKPSDDSVDARQAHPALSLTPKQGIGSADEPIVVTLSPVTPNVPDCFALCESAADPQTGANAIAEVVSLPGGKYRIVLDRPITPNAITTLEYLGGGDWVQFTSHPANTNADPQVDLDDVDWFLACCLDAICDPAAGPLQCDVDHSGFGTLADLPTLIDLINGAATFDPAAGTLRPVTEDCP